MPLSQILSRRSGSSSTIKEDSNKTLKKSPSYFGRLASFSLLRKKSSVSIKKQPITIRRVYTEYDMVNFNFKTNGEADDDNEYAIDEILSPYSDDVSDICTTSEMSVEERERKNRYEESIECATVELDNFSNEDRLSIKVISEEISKENESPSASSSIFEKADSLLFEDDAISHSTSRYSLKLSKPNDTDNYNVLDFVPNEQYTDIGSINDANIAVFKTPSKKLNLKLVGRSPVLLQSTSLAHKSVSPEMDTPYLIVPNDSRKSKNLNNIDSIKNKDPRIEHESMYLAKGNLEVDSHDIYKNEMAMLVQEHKLIVRKHEKEISYLKDLLQQERNINKLLIACQQKKSNLKIESSHMNRMRRKFIPIDITVGSETDKSNNEPNNPRDCPIMIQDASPFLNTMGYKTPTKAMNKNVIRDRGLPIAPTINHSTPEGIFCTGLDNEAWKAKKEQQRKDAYHALTHKALKENETSKENIDFASLNKVFGSSKTAMKTQNSVSSFDSILTTLDFSNSFLMLHA